MDDTRMEVWSMDSAPSRTCCRIARIPDGFAVLVFDGDACVFSEIRHTLERAHRLALRVKREYFGTRAARKRPARRAKALLS